jgi:hypothetical protein
MTPRQDLLSALGNAEYHLAEAEMHYDRTGDEFAAGAIKSWSAEVQKLERKIEELERV